MNIKNNLANIVSVSRIFVAYGAIALLYVKTTWAYLLAFVLTIIAFSMDGLDGYLARKLNQSSEWGSVLDILGDRIVEISYWTVFSVMGWISIIFPLICTARAFTTDGIRSVALSQGMTAFGDNIRKQNETINQYSLYYDNNVRITDKVSTRVGVHFVAYNPVNFRNYYSIQPRFALNFTPGKNNLIYLNFSKMEQFYHYISFNGFALPTDFRMRATRIWDSDKHEENSITELT